MTEAAAEGKPNTSSQGFGRDLTVGSIPRHLVAFSLPMLTGSLLQTAYAFINAIWVGKFLGKTALAAVTVGFPIILVLIAIGIGLTMATNILVSQHYGAKNMSEMRRVIDSSVLMVIGLSVLLTVPGIIFTPHIMRVMDTPADVMPLAVSYMRIFALTLPFGFGLFLTRSMLQGIGDSKTPLYFQIGGIVLTAVLDPLLMFGWLGFPKLGLNGTAWATVVAQAGSLAALVYYLERTKNPVAPRWVGLQMDWQTALITMKIGLPTAIQQSLIAIGMVFVTGIVNGFGENVTAALGAVGRLEQLAFMPAMTFSVAIATLAGQNIGAGKHSRVKDVFLWGCLLSGGVTLMATLLVTTIPSTLLHIFVNDQTVVSIGVKYLHIVGLSYVFFAIAFVSNGIINGSGHTFITTIISIISLWTVRVPLAFYLSRRLHSEVGIWYAMALGFFVSMCVSLIYYFSGHWKKAVIRHRPAPDVPAEEVAEA